MNLSLISTEGIPIRVGPREIMEKVFTEESTVRVMMVRPDLEAWSSV